MNDKDLQRHNWGEVQEALRDLQTHTEEHEPYAKTYLAAIETVLDGMPQDE